LNGENWAAAKDKGKNIKRAKNKVMKKYGLFFANGRTWADDTGTVTRELKGRLTAIRRGGKHLFDYLFPGGRGKEGFSPGPEPVIPLNREKPGCATGRAAGLDSTGL